MEAAQNPEEHCMEKPQIEIVDGLLIGRAKESDMTIFVRDIVCMMRTGNTITITARGKSKMTVSFEDEGLANILQKRITKEMKLHC